LCRKKANANISDTPDCLLFSNMPELKMWFGKHATWETQWSKDYPWAFKIFGEERAYLAWNTQQEDFFPYERM